MKIVHIVPHIDKEAAGPSYSVPRLCTAQAHFGHQVILSCLAAKAEIPGVQTLIHSQWPVLSRFAVSTAHTRDLRHRVITTDIVHNHSLWSMVNVAAGWVVPGQRARLVTSPRGTLSQWALLRQRKFKQILWPIQRRVLQRADLLHATSVAEYHDIRALGLKVPVAIIPNGIDLPVLENEVSRSPNAKRTLLFLGRIHPVKGLERLLQAWVQLQEKFPDWKLVITGPGETEHVKAVQNQAVALGLARVEFTGPVYGKEKTAAYHEADLYVLPSHSENFAMSVAEALAHGVPAVVSQGAPWEGLISEDCGWWVSNDVQTLQQALVLAMSCSVDVLHRKGQRGREWMERDFAWTSIAQRMLLSYEWVLKGGTAPDWIRVD